MDTTRHIIGGKVKILQTLVSGNSIKDISCSLKGNFAIRNVEFP